MFSFRFINKILAGKPILARPRKRECMEAAKIGPDLMLKLVIKAGRNKFENNGAVVYVGSSLALHNPLLFVHKLWSNKLMRFFYLSVSLKC